MFRGMHTKRIIFTRIDITIVRRYLATRRKLMLANDSRDLRRARSRSETTIRIASLLIIEPISIRYLRHFALRYVLSSSIMRSYDADRDNWNVHAFANCVARNALFMTIRDYRGLFRNAKA